MFLLSDLMTSLSAFRLFALSFSCLRIISINLKIMLSPLVFLKSLKNDLFDFHSSIKRHPKEKHTACTTTHNRIRVGGRRMVKRGSPWCRGWNVGLMIKRLQGQIPVCCCNIGNPRQWGSERPVLLTVSPCRERSKRIPTSRKNVGVGILQLLTRA